MGGELDSLQVKWLMKDYFINQMVDGGYWKTASNI